MNYYVNILDFIILPYIIPLFYGKAENVDESERPEQQGFQIHRKFDNAVREVFGWVCGRAWPQAHPNTSRTAQR
jgi:hypothetical protein